MLALYGVLFSALGLGLVEKISLLEYTGQVVVTFQELHDLQIVGEL